MLEILLNSAKPAIKQLITNKCLEKLNKGEDSISITTDELEALLSKHLGINFLSVNIYSAGLEVSESRHTEIKLIINEVKLHVGK